MNLFWSILAFSGLVALAWYILSHEKIEAGKIIIVLNAGGSFVFARMGYVPGYYLNSPEDEKNHDPRYNDWDIIPTQDVIGEDGSRSYHWGPPGYENRTTAENEAEYNKLSKEDQKKFWKTYQENRGVIEKKFGFIFIGLAGFFKLYTWQYSERKLVPAQKVLKKFSNSEEDHDEYPEWQESWISHDKSIALINKPVNTTQLPIFIDDATVVTDAETGMEGKNGVNEMIPINTVHNGQISIENALTALLRAPNITRSVNTVLASSMRSFTANRSLDQIQKTDHNHTSPDSDYLVMIKALRGGWEGHGINYTRTDGTAKNFGYTITSEYYFSSWSPANDDAAAAINSRLKLYVSEQNIQIAENEGTARGKRVKAELELKGDAEKKYLEKVRDVVPDPNVKVYSEAMGNLKGTYAPGTGGIQTVLNLAQNTTIPEPPKTEKND